MLSRLVKNVWDLDNFIKEVESKYPNTYSKEALEVIFDNAKYFPGYCCLEELTRDFEEWTLEEFASFISNKYKESLVPEKVEQFVYDEWSDDGEITHPDIIKVLTSTILLHPDFRFYNYEKDN